MLHRVKESDLASQDFWVLDEIHMCANPQTRRTHLLYGFLKSLLPKYLLGLSGSIMRNDPKNLWVPIALCTLNPKATSGLTLTGNLAKYWAFARHFSNVEKIRLGRGRTVEKFTGVRIDRLPELRALLAQKIVRYKIEDVMKELPELVRIPVSVPLARVPGLEEEWEAFQAGRKTDSTAKRLSAEIKAPHTAEYIRHIRDAGSGPILCFTVHPEAARTIAENIPNSVVISGSTPMDFRAEAVRRYQAGDIDCIVATCGALGVGVTLTRGNVVVFNDLPWVPADLEQCEARVRRIGQLHTVFSHVIESSEIDRRISEVLLQKSSSIKQVFE